MGLVNCQLAEYSESKPAVHCYLVQGGEAALLHTTHIRKNSSKIGHLVYEQILPFPCVAPGDSSYTSSEQDQAQAK